MKRQALDTSDFLMKPRKPDYSTADGQKRIMLESVGYDAESLMRRIDTNRPGDYGADPMGDGSFKMVPSGDIVNLAERNRRLGSDDASQR